MKWMGFALSAGAGVVLGCMLEWGWPAWWAVVLWFASYFSGVLLGKADS
jgi:hypothetical protein